MPSGKVLPAPAQGNGLAEENSVRLFNQRSLLVLLRYTAAPT